MSSLCSICQQVFTDPVIAMDGHTYDRHCIQQWFDSGNNTSPMTREVIGHTLIINHTMRSELTDAGRQIVSLNTVITTKNTSPVRITLVLDISGSMDSSVGNGNEREPTFSRLDLVKHSAASIAAMMRPNDELSIVVFSGSTRLLLDWTKIDDGGAVKHRCKDKIYQLDTMGTTDIVSGLQRAVGLGGDHIILLTDGDNTYKPHGITLGDYILDKIGHYQGTIHCVGLGMDTQLDTPTLRKIAKVKNGFYLFCPDGSMVCTTFVHLMANILVNEVGEPFEQYNEFLAFGSSIENAMERGDCSSALGCISIAEYTFGNNSVLKEEITSDDPNKGQIEKAVLNWNTWGRHYLPAFFDSHAKRMTSNFKDASLQGYATANTRLAIEAAEATFIGVEIPIPSCNNYGHRSFNTTQFANVALSSQGTCFAGDTKISVAIKTEGLSYDLYAPVRIDNVRKGMVVRTAWATATVKCVVVGPEVEMVRVDDFWVSKNHPLREDGIGSVWKYAEEYSDESAGTKMCKCYNLVLSDYHTIMIGDFEAVALGHGKYGDVVEHEYLGTSRVISDLEREPDWERGYIELKGVKRNEHGNICGLRFE